MRKFFVILPLICLMLATTAFAVEQYSPELMAKLIASGVAPHEANTATNWRASFDKSALVTVKVNNVAMTNIIKADGNYKYLSRLVKNVTVEKVDSDITVRAKLDNKTTQFSFRLNDLISVITNNANTLKTKSKAELTYWAVGEYPKVNIDAVVTVTVNKVAKTIDITLTASGYNIVVSGLALETPQCRDVKSSQFFRTVPMC